MKDFHIRESHRDKRIVGGLDVGAVVPGTAAAVNHDELISGQRFEARPQLRKRGGIASRADVLRIGDVRLQIEHVKTDVNQQRLLSLGIQNRDQFVGLEDLRVGDRTRLNGECRESDHNWNRDSRGNF